MASDSANEITSLLLIEIPKRLPHVRVWRRNVGGGYPVAVVKTALSLLLRGQVEMATTTLKRARIVSFGVPGEPDIDGVAGPSGLRIGIEVKAGRDVQSPEQAVCQRVWESHGAVYIIARTVEQAIAELESKLAGVRGNQ
jgi:predicted RecB family endonuclease